MPFLSNNHSTSYLDRRAMDQSSARRIAIIAARQMAPRNLFFLLFNIMALFTFYQPMRNLMSLSLSYDALYSHIVLIPLVSGYFIYLRRKSIFSNVRYEFTLGIIIITLGIVLYLLGMTRGLQPNQNDSLSLMAFSGVTLWIGGFVFFYGVQAFREAAFPLLFLVFMIPLPTLFADKIIYFLQTVSAEVSFEIIKFVGVPVFREGFVFQLPGISVEVAKQCSGIRSTLALFITSILAGHMFLQSRWNKVILVLAVFPIAVFKNGLRIVTLSLLGAYVDEKIITQSLLHSKGGIPFFILALVFMLPVLWILRKREEKKIIGEKIPPTLALPLKGRGN